MVEFFVKAFLLRGRGDSLGLQLALAAEAKRQLEQERQALQEKMDTLDRAIEKSVAEVDSIQSRVAVVAQSGVADPLGLEAQKLQLENINPEAMHSELKEKGRLSIEEARVRAAVVSQATSDDLARFMDRLSVTAQTFTDSDTFKSVAEQALQMSDIAAEQAQIILEALNDSDTLKSVTEQAHQLSDAAAEQAQKFVDTPVQAPKDLDTSKSVTEQSQEESDTAAEQAQKITDKNFQL